MTTNNVNVIEITEAIATINTNVEGTIKFNAKWDMFIVPNQAVPMIDDFMSVGYATKQLDKISRLLKYNDIDEFSVGMNEKLVQVWYCNDKCENGVRHYPYVIDQDGKRWDIKFEIGEYLPESFAKQFYEGRTIKVNIPVNLEYWNEETDETEERKAIMMCEITAKQKAYRYRMFGTFEETLQKVLS